jgi:predicted O-methyltransferase YrrM
MIRTLANNTRRALFRLAEKFLRIHMTPVHFYSPIPDVGGLSDDHFGRVRECVGLDFRTSEQLVRLDQTFSRYAREYTPPVNSGLSRVDALALYAMIRDRKPGLLIEIGSGESTKISLSAIRKNEEEGHRGRMVAIEPYPQAYLRGIDHRLELIEEKVQELSADFLAQADVLFIDSSHVSKIGSDVNFEILEVLPKLRVGTLVHWHDIMIPTEYPRAWIEHGNMFWNESYLVHAFMLFNDSFRTVWASKYMQLTHPDRLHQVFPYFEPTDPDQQLSSFWIERVK